MTEYLTDLIEFINLLLFFAGFLDRRINFCTHSDDDDDDDGHPGDDDDEDESADADDDDDSNSDGSASDSESSTEDSASEVRIILIHDNLVLFRS